MTNRTKIVLLSVLAALLLAGIITLAVILTGTGKSGEASRSPTITELPPSVTSTVTPSPTGVPVPPDDETSPSPEQQLHFKEVLESGNTAALEQELANPVDLILAGSECCGSIPSSDAITELGYVGPGSGATWNFDPDDATLGALRAGDYAAFFPPNAIVGISSDGYLLSFVPGSDGLIARILINVFP